MRLIAVAVRDFPPIRQVYNLADERALTLVGYVAFLDPPKETAAPALRALKEHGVQVKVLTGDNELVTLKVCRMVGLTHDTPVLGPDIDAMETLPWRGQPKPKQSLRG